MSVVIPTVGTSRPVWGVTRPLVLGAVRSLLDVSTYADVEVIVVTDPATPADVITQLGHLDVRLIPADGPFNYSRRCNEGVAASSGEYVVLLNDDVLIEQPDWLEVMVGLPSKLVSASVAPVSVRTARNTSPGWIETGPWLASLSEVRITVPPRICWVR